MALTPDSFSSLVTIFDFVLIDSSIIVLRMVWFLFIIFFGLFSIIFLSFLLPIKAYLITSPNPELNSFLDNVFKKFVDIKTRLGL